MKIEIFARLLSPIYMRIQSLVARAIVSSINDTYGVQIAKISMRAGEVKENVERIQDYGFTGNPPDGSEGVVFFLGGTREHGIILRVDNRNIRLKNLEKGEVAIYTDEGDKIHLKRDNKIEVTSAGQVKVVSPSVKVEAEFVEIIAEVTSITGEVVVDGNVLVTGSMGSGGGMSSGGEVSDQDGTLDEIREAYNIHKHHENGAGNDTNTTDTPV